MLCLSRTETCETALMACDDDDEEGQYGSMDDDYTHISIPLPGHGLVSNHCVESKEKEQTTTINNEVTKHETRAVPIFCAVCHAQYKVSERVCWASNAKCTHVFHEDCLLQGLVSLGRRRTMGEHFNKNSSEKELMKYQPECAYCRQHFINKILMTVKDDF